MTIAPRSLDMADVYPLDEPAARDPGVVGSKAAALAATAATGLPVVPGFAVGTRVHGAYLAAGRVLPPELERSLLRAWGDFSAEGRLPVVVRSSSTVEDVASSSMAGRFRSVLDVRSREGFLAAVQAVWASADAVAQGAPPGPMGVLVQRHLAPDRSGVMFGVDPVTGADATIAVDVVTGGPDKLVSGRVTAQHYVVTRQGRPLSIDHQPARTVPHHVRLLSRRELRALARLARDTARVFGSPQDVEWALDDDGVLWLLQSRPVTATAATAPGEGTVLGPGPLAETFPDPLGALEVDLWVRPLRAGVVDAMEETGAVAARRLDASPVVTTINGRVAADLELFGYVRTHRRNPLRLLDPRPGLRHMRVAWRTGSLRAALPERARRQVAEADAWLATADPRASSSAELLELLAEAVDRLRHLHHTEVLAGTLLPATARTAASVALEVAADSVSEPRDPALLRRHPVLLSLLPPSLQDRPPVPDELQPPSSAAQRAARSERDGGALGEREQLRLRARWVQELTVYAARELGRQLVAGGFLEHAEDVSLLRLEELAALVQGDLDVDLEERRGQELALAFSPPLPAEFRLGLHGEVVPAARHGARPTGYGTPAGGGRGVGVVNHGTVRRPPAPGDVLVVRTLDPALAGWLPGLAGLVAETGASLSHLAILAREYGVPTVVAVPDALTRFAPGTRLLVDGATGEVRAVGGEVTS